MCEYLCESVDVKRKCGEALQRPVEEGVVSRCSLCGGRTTDLSGTKSCEDVEVLV
jgi:hypothetical protein